MNANGKFTFAHRMGLISDDVYETAKESCNGDYVVVDPFNTKCLLALQEYKKNFNYVLAYNWANDPQVRDALHVRKDTVREWLRCNFSIDYTKNVESVVDIHRFLTAKELNVLVQNGDRDMVVPFTATMEWIKSLNLTVDEEWRPWFVDGQIAGYTEKYYKNQNGYRLVFAIVKGAGHTAPEYYRRRCFHMFDRWAHWYPL